MGLGERRLIADIQEKDIPKYQNRIAEHGAKVSLQVNWEAIPQDTTRAIDVCKTVLGDLTTKLWSIAEAPIGREALAGKVDSVRLEQDGSQTDSYGYRLELQGRQLVFKANFSIFTINPNKQTPFQKAIEALL